MWSESLTAPARSHAVLPRDLHVGGDTCVARGGTCHIVRGAPGQVSTGHHNSWADFLELALPRAVQLAAEEHVELRQGEPSPGADVGGGEPSPDADVGGVSPVLVQMWGASR